MPFAQEIFDMLDIGSKPFQVFPAIVSIKKKRKFKSHRIRCYQLCDGFRLFLSMGIDGLIDTHLMELSKKLGTPLNSQDLTPVIK